jgi:hypothetical protein
MTNNNQISVKINSFIGGETIEEGYYQNIEPANKIQHIEKDFESFNFNN